MEAVEVNFVVAVAWLKLILEVAAATFVAIGGATTLGRLARAAVAPRRASFTALRLHFARYLSLALEFQLAADIVGTTIAPTWEQIGKLGAIAIVRTGLNYFLGVEMREERETIAGEKVAEAPPESRAVAAGADIT